MALRGVNDGISARAGYIGSGRILYAADVWVVGVKNWSKWIGREIGGRDNSRVILEHGGMYNVQWSHEGWRWRWVEAGGIEVVVRASMEGCLAGKVG